jgi:adenosylcobinamide-phosphate synthase
MLDKTTLFTLLLALALDASVGYPDGVYRKIGHPVTWIGALIATLETKLNRTAWRFAARRAGGVVAVVVLVGLPVVLAVAVQGLVPGGVIGAVIIAVLASTLIASKSLYDHVSAVAVALAADGLAGGRVAVARIVGRDPETLDEAGVARAAIESLAENASDGIVAPVFWFAVLGLPGLVAYKAINTADSMIGHRNARYEAFGWAAARLDDLVNLPASRLTGFLFAIAAFAISGGSASGAFAAMVRDAGRHRSPNAGWPESAMAGALDLKLAGPRVYGGELVDDAFMGTGRRDATGADITRALRLATVAWVLMVAGVALGAAVLSSLLPLT